MLQTVGFYMKVDTDLRMTLIRILLYFRIITHCVHI